MTRRSRRTPEHRLPLREARPGQGHGRVSGGRACASTWAASRRATWSNAASTSCDAARGPNTRVVTAGGDSRLLGDRRGTPVDGRYSRSAQRRRGGDNGAAARRSDLDVRRLRALLRRRRRALSPHHRAESPAGRSSGVHSATVIGPDAVMTDALSTSVFVMGVDQGLRLIAPCRTTKESSSTPTVRSSIRTAWRTRRRRRSRLCRRRRRGAARASRTGSPAVAKKTPGCRRIDDDFFTLNSA